jgi:3-hydroxyacyl-[acyl-carrier-protein] dehydratase
MHAPSSSPTTLERVQLLLRRDLKLGPDAAIPPDMPFFGGDVDLDSLDILLLVTSIEKEMGVKIPSDKIGKDIFKNVTTLVEFIELNMNGEALAGVVGSPTTSPQDLLEHLPHGPEFRFITRVDSAKPGEEATGTWEIKGDETFFKGHFPGNPLVPGVLITEALAQLSGIAGASAGKSGMIAHIDVRFHRPVAPPASITLNAKLNRLLGELQQFDVTASLGAETIASGSITLHRPS